MTPPTFAAMTGIFDKKFVDHLAAQTTSSRDATIHILLHEPSATIISSPAKQEILTAILIAFKINTTIRTHFTPNLIDRVNQTSSELTGNLLFSYSLDYLTKDHVPTELKNFSNNILDCFEHSIAYMVAWYHIAANTKNTSLMQQKYQELITYLGDQKIADIYLQNNIMKHDALVYFSGLTKPEQPFTADFVPFKEVDSIIYTLIGERKYFPTGMSGLGGFVDYVRTETQTPSDLEISTSKHIPLTVVTALREGVEEIGKQVVTQKATRIYGKENKNNTVVYYISQGSLRLEIRESDQVANNTYIEDPKTMKSPADPRGLVSTAFYKMRIVEGIEEGGDDIGELKWIPINEIPTQPFAMAHHREIYTRLFLK